MSDKPTKAAKEQQEKREELTRSTPQKIVDQGETVQVGGTVVNAPQNLGEYDVDEEHNYNEGDPDNEHYNAELDSADLTAEDSKDEKKEDKTREENTKAAVKEEKKK